MLAEHAGLAPKERDFLAAFLRVYDEKRSAPTMREMCLAVGLRSNASAFRYARILAAKGWLEQLPNGQYLPARTVRP